MENGGWRMENGEWRMDCHEGLGSRLHGCVICAIGLEWKFSERVRLELYLSRRYGRRRNLMLRRSQ